MHTITDDGTRLFISRIGDRDCPPLILSHGTFSNQRSCTPLARHLAALGWQCWLFDWRGHGSSAMPRHPYNFETIAGQDVVAILRAVEEECAPQRPFWLGHSGGGLIASLWLARQGADCSRLAGLLLLAAQASSTGRPWWPQWQIRLMSMLLPLRQQISPRWATVASEAESSLLLRQWCRWNLRGAIRSADGFDYQAALGQQSLPVLALAGGGDCFISPPDGCRHLLQSFASHDKRFVLCDRAHGFLEDYSHDRLLLSKNAKNEIWPLLANWLEQHAALSRAPAQAAARQHQAGEQATRPGSRLLSNFDSG
ncbi:alpha/beta hydrolase [Aquitalea magnusonii]|uniref:Alpha-beta hydrolase superfamily lysophospholipase n=1 Tax=Aquitalea magnusonii TaxID=332411 RepID=A0A318J4M6_9NEIS|nr:alpha/beta fold hydrolase [Aquitalea magnusonii]PXX42734.1 alpha-beta hydrolase superfamily lysophospholipase [Aquitalea magnusonii]